MPREWDCRGLVNYLAEAKRHGLTFEWAWTMGLERFPPRGSDQIVAEASGALTLFDEQGVREESVADAMKRFCEDAWFGDRPGLASFSLDLFRAAEDESSSVSHQSNFRLAA